MKSNRQAAILELIAANNIETQKALAAALNAAGFPATQANVSRDIREMGLIKSPDGAYRRPESAEKSILAQAVRTVTAARNLVVVKTASGMAQAAAAVIDGLGLDGLVGCIAGDDTVLCVAPDDAGADALEKKLREFLA
jgi:transcriptional regulator of arginine metabolism